LGQPVSEPTTYDPYSSFMPYHPNYCRTKHGRRFVSPGCAVLAKCSTTQHKNELPESLHTVRGFKNTTSRLCKLLMKGSWLEEHLYDGESTRMILARNDEFYGTKKTQRKILNSMSACFIKATKSLHQRLFSPNETDKNTAGNGRFLVQKMMEDIRKVLEEPFGYIDPMSTNWSGKDVYTGFGSGVGYDILATEYSLRDGKQRKPNLKEKYQWLFKFLITEEEVPHEVLFAIGLEKIPFADLSILVSMVQYFPASVFTLEHLLCKIYQLVNNARPDVFGKKNPMFDKKHTFPVRNIHPSVTYPWDDASNARICSSARPFFRRSKYLPIRTTDVYR